MSPSLRYTAFSIIAIFIIGSGWYVLQHRSSSGPAQAGTNVALPFAAAQAANNAALSSQATAAAEEAAVAPFTNTYKNATYGFSFKYPSNLKIGGSSSPDGSETTILAQDVATHIGFQIYITPFNNSNTVITAARVTHDLPNLIIRGAQVAQIGASSPGLAFLTEDTSFGESRQVWVVYQKYLYQISTYSSQDTLLQKVLATWVFTKTKK